MAVDLQDAVEMPLTRFLSIPKAAEGGVVGQPVPHTRSAWVTAASSSN